MSILIEGMEMPDYGYVCLKVFANGEVLMTKEHRGALVITGIKDKVGTAVPIPPHGDLIDRDKLPYSRIRIAHPTGNIGGWNAVVMSAAIKDAPVIIPAEEGGETR